jgi:hypothetical protein
MEEGSRSEKKIKTEQVERVVMLQVEYDQPNDTHHFDARNNLENVLRKRGYNSFESSGSRFLIEDVKNFGQFLEEVKKIGKEFQIKIRRVVRMQDPGLGLMLFFPEDFPPGGMLYERPYVVYGEADSIFFNE